MHFGHSTAVFYWSIIEVWFSLWCNFPTDFLTDIACSDFFVCNFCQVGCKTLLTRLNFICKHVHYAVLQCSWWWVTLYKHTQMNSFYSSLDLVLSHWANFTLHRFICVYLCIFCFFIVYICCIIVSTVRWTWWDWSLILRNLSSFSV